MRRMWLGLLALLLCTAHGVHAQSRMDVAVEVRPPAVHTAPVEGVVVSRDSRLLISASQDKSLILWDLPSGRSIRVFKGHENSVSRPAISPDGAVLASGSADKSIRLWDIASGSLIRTLSGHTDGIGAVAFSSDGRNLLSTGDDKSVRIWDVASGTVTKVVRLPESGATLRVLSDNRVLVGGERTIFLVETASATVAKSYRGHSDRVGALSVSPDGAAFLSGSDDGTFKVWSLSAQTPQLTVRAHGRGIKDPENSKGSRVRAVEFSPDGRTFASAGYDGTIKLWEAGSNRQLRVIKLPVEKTTSGEALPDDAFDLAFAPDGHLVSGHINGAIRVWNPADGMLVREMIGHESFDNVTLSASGSVAASQDTDQIVRTWDLTTGALLRAVPVTRRKDFSAGTGLALSNTGTTLFVRGTDSSLEVWSGKPDPLRTRTGGSLGSEKMLAIAPDGGMVLASTSLHDVASGKMLRKLATTESVYAAAFSPDGSTILVGSDEGSTNDIKARVFDARTGKQVRQLVAGKRPADTGEGQLPVNAVTFAPDGRGAATGASDERLTVWDTGTWRPSYTMPGVHRGGVTALAYSPDSRTLASGGADNTVRLWDASSGRARATLIGHSDEIRSIAFRSDRVLVSASKDLVFKYWDATNGQLLATRVLFGGDNWVVVTAEGFFEHSGNGATQLSVAQGLQLYSIDQFYAVLHRPDLVAEKLAGDPRGIVRDAAARLDLGKAIGSGSPPWVSLRSPSDATTSDAQVTMEAVATDAGGGVGHAEWRVNGVTQGVTRGLGRPGAGEEGRGLTRPGDSVLRQALTLGVGQNVIDVRVYNQKGLVASEPVSLTITRTGAAQAPRLFVLAAGVDAYDDGALRLAFSAADARSFADALRVAGGRLYRSIEVTTLLDKDVTATQLDRAFADIGAKVTPDDVFVFYIAGHGKTVDGRYYFLPRDFRYDGEASFSRSGIGQDRWQDWMRRIAAQKSILLYDTCDSGALTAEKIATRGLEEKTALDFLTRATGRTTLTAATAAAPALEGYGGHGVFTYALLDALDKADINGDGLVDLDELITYVNRTVPEISERAFRMGQYPQVARNGGNFPLANRTAVLTGAATTSSRFPVRATHVVIATATVRDEPKDDAVAVTTVGPGTLLRLVETANGWTLVARDGQKLGYLRTGSIVPTQ